MIPFVVMKYPESMKKRQQFIGFQTEFFSSRMLSMDMIVQKESFIHDDSPGFECADKSRK
jgi:hypothetical protein